MEKRKAWLEKVSEGKSDREKSLLKRASETLQSNIYLEEDNYPWSPYRCVCPSKKKFKGIWNWDSAFHAMGLSWWDTDLAKESVLGFLQFQKESGLLPDVIRTNGVIEDEYSKPPVFPWATKIVFDRCNDLDFLKEVYPKFKLNEKWWVERRQYNGLFHYDAENEGDEKYEKFIRWESGWDDSVRWDSPIVEQWAIDLNSFMVDYYRAMSYFAKVLNLDSDYSEYAKKEKDLIKLINEVLWDDEQKCYVDVNRFTGEKSKAITPASFMPLFINIAPLDKAKHMEKIALEKFYSGMPTVSYDNKEYSTTYWRGPTWLNVAYFAAKGLKNYGFKVADDIKETILSWVDKNEDSIYENYDSKTGFGIYGKDFSWSSVFVVEFILNF